MGDLRCAIVGTGMMGREHQDNLAVLEGARLVSLCDPDPGSLAGAVAAATAVGSAETTEADQPHVATFTDHHELLDALSRGAIEVDAVILASPNHTHRDVLEPFWDTGLHLFIEKPLCTTVEDARAVQARAADHDGLVWMGLEYRYLPAVDELIARVRDGAVGAVRMVSVREHRYPFLAKVGDWNRFTRNTGGTLVEKCCHFFDLMNLAVGARPERVFASGAQDVNHLDERYDGEVPDILDNAFVIVDYPGGVRAMLDVCMFAEGSRWEQELVVVGDAGKVEANVPGFMGVVRGAQPELVVGSRGPDWPVEVHPVADSAVAHRGSHHGASYVELERFVAAIRGGAAAEVTVEDGVWSVAMGVAAHRSIETGQPVTLAELGLH